MENELELLRQTFVEEATEGLAAMEEALVALESQPDNGEPLLDVLRIAHTLKGSAAMVAFENVAEYAHLLEDALESLRRGEQAIGVVHVTILLQIVDALRGILKAAAGGRTTDIRAADRALVGRLIPGGALAAAEAAARGAGTTAGAGSSRAATRVRTLRVGMERLDSLLDLTGEIAVARGRLLGVLAAQRGGASDRGRVAAEELDRLLVGLQEQVMQMRLVPLGLAFRQHLRTVRDISALQGKVVRLVTEGDDVHVDASIVDRIRDPLTHMVRNATDHGIEYPAQRAAAGKDPCGTVTLRARHEGGSVVIEVADDGAGLDTARVLARARAMRIPGAETMTERELHELVFRPGFSTAESVSEISGRGVGMDIVRRDIESLRGTVTLASERGRGAVATIRLPLTLAIIDGLAVDVGGDTYVVPLDSVTECVELPADESARNEATGILSLRGESLPYLRLRARFGCAGQAAGRESVVVVRDAIGQAGFVVDGLQGERQAVLKPLGRLFAGLPGISGSTIVGDGRVALILDVPAILGETRAARRAAPSLQSA